jgi:hypothetical protein
MTTAILCTDNVTEALAATRRYMERIGDDAKLGDARGFFLGYLIGIDYPDVLAALNELSQAETQRDYARLVATEPVCKWGCDGSGQGWVRDSEDDGHIEPCECRIHHDCNEPGACGNSRCPKCNPQYRDRVLTEPSGLLSKVVS